VGTFGKQFSQNLLNGEGHFYKRGRALLQTKWKSPFEMICFRKQMFLRSKLKDQLKTPFFNEPKNFVRRV
jgi:hypothetical protein